MSTPDSPAPGRYAGVCVGGPLHGVQALSRFPQGFLLVDKPANQCWIYEWDGDHFQVRDPEPMPVSTEGHINRYRAAAEGSYDVLAAPWTSPPDPATAGAGEP